MRFRKKRRLKASSFFLLQTLSEYFSKIFFFFYNTNATPVFWNVTCMWPCARPTWSECSPECPPARCPRGAFGRTRYSWLCRVRFPSLCRWCRSCCPPILRTVPSTPRSLRQLMLIVTRSWRGAKRGSGRDRREERCWRDFFFFFYHKLSSKYSLNFK